MIEIVTKIGNANFYPESKVSETILVKTSRSSSLQILWTSDGKSFFFTFVLANLRRFQC